MLKIDDFSDRVGSRFAIVTDSPGIPELVLTEAAPLPLHGATDPPRAPFSLVFDQPGTRILPQGLYRLRHADMGDLDIFLVPMAQNPSTVRYCATFN